MRTQILPPDHPLFLTASDNGFGSYVPPTDVTLVIPDGEDGDSDCLRRALEEIAGSPDDLQIAIRFATGEPRDQIARDFDYKSRVTVHRIAEKANDKLRAGIVAIIAGDLLRRENGFTLDVATAEPVCFGYGVSLARYQRVYQRMPAYNDLCGYLWENLQEFNLRRDPKKPTPYFGGWQSPSDGSYYLDLTVLILDLSDAMTIAKAESQYFIWDFVRCENVPVG